MSVICAISIALPPPRIPLLRRPSSPRDPRRCRGRACARVIAMTHRAGTWHLRRARGLALVAVAALRDVRQHEVGRAGGRLGRVAARALLLLVVLVIEPAVDHVARGLAYWRDLERAAPAGRRMAF